MPNKHQQQNPLSEDTLKVFAILIIAIAVVYIIVSIMYLSVAIPTPVGAEAHFQGIDLPGDTDGNETDQEPYFI